MAMQNAEEGLAVAPRVSKIVHTEATAAAD